MYQVILDKRVLKEIDFLPAEVIQTVYDAIQALPTNPRPHGVKKLIGKDGWRVRAGDYRVLYTIDDKNKTVSIYRVKHRKDVYK